MMAANGNPCLLRKPCSGPTVPLLMQFLDFGNFQLPARHDFPERKIAFLALKLFVILVDLAAAFRARHFQRCRNRRARCRSRIFWPSPRCRASRPRFRFINSSRLNLPRAIWFNLNSHSPVSSGEHNSGMSKPRSSVINENAFAVGCNSRPLRFTYFSQIKPSMIVARVAGVPRPFSLIASRNSSSSINLPAPSIAPSNVASEYRAGGLV